MPHSTLDEPSARRASFKFPGDTKPNLRTSMEKFPDHVDSVNGNYLYVSSPIHMNGCNSPVQTGVGGWWNYLRKALHRSNRDEQASTGRRHGRQKSLSEAIRTVRTRNASVSQNAHEIADALKVTWSWTFVGLCMIWYASSAVTNSSSKWILNDFNKPGTLTIIQFMLVAAFCITLSKLSAVFPVLKRTIPSLEPAIRYPTRDIVATTLPLGVFQVFGHLLSSNSMAKIPVSLVHTIKGLSPLFTVLAYHFVFNNDYPVSTWISLIPLTVGVMLSCAAEFTGNFIGILFAFLGTVVFVVQNIWSKKLFNAASSPSHQKLDKLNLLFYSSGIAFLLTIPYWLWTEGLDILFSSTEAELTATQQQVTYSHLAIQYLFNGSTHFLQNILAFVLLSMVSPVTYSVASLVKRIFVILLAILVFRQHLSGVQWFGIALTAFGLYLYDASIQTSKAEKKAKMMDIEEETILPLANLPGGSISSSMVRSNSPRTYTNGYALYSGTDDKKDDDIGRSGRARGQSNRPGMSSWRPPGTRQEETWKPSEMLANGNVPAISTNAT